MALTFWMKLGQRRRFGIATPYLLVLNRQYELMDRMEIEPMEKLRILIKQSSNLSLPLGHRQNNSPSHFHLGYEGNKRPRTLMLRKYSLEASLRRGTTVEEFRTCQLNCEGPTRSFSAGSGTKMEGFQTCQPKCEQVHEKFRFRFWNKGCMCQNM